MEDAKGKVLGEATDKDGAGAAIVTWEATEDTAIRIICMSASADGAGVCTVFVRPKK